MPRSNASEANRVYPLRPNVAMLVYRPQSGELWIGERAGEQGHWQFPQGGVDEGDTLEVNVLRELEEELGVPKSAFGRPVRLNATHSYEFAKPREYGKEIFRGQSQTFWAVPFVGQDSAIRLDAHEREFDSWRWVTPEEALRIAAPKRLKGYEGAVAEFRELYAAGKLRGNRL